MTRWPGDGNANDIVLDNDGILTRAATFAPGVIAQAFPCRLSMLDTLLITTGLVLETETLGNLPANPES